MKKFEYESNCYVYRQFYRSVLRPFWFFEICYGVYFLFLLLKALQIKSPSHNTLPCEIWCSDYCLCGTRVPSNVFLLLGLATPFRTLRYPIRHCGGKRVELLVGVFRWNCSYFLVLGSTDGVLGNVREISSIFFFLALRTESFPLLRFEIERVL